MMALAALTIVAERDHIGATNKELFAYVLSFPIYMLSYMPISFQAIFSKLSGSQSCIRLSGFGPCFDRRSAAMSDSAGRADAAAAGPSSICGMIGLYSCMVYA